MGFLNRRSSYSLFCVSLIRPFAPSEPKNRAASLDLEGVCLPAKEGVMAHAAARFGLSFAYCQSTDLWYLLRPDSSFPRDHTLAIIVA
jgi:hypothetical protein